MRVEVFTFLVAGAICVGGALGVVLFRNPVHNALSLVATLFGVAVLFIAQEAYFLAAIQVIVYAGAIVVLFLFVIMLLGVDRAEAIERDPFRLRRAAAIVGGAVLLAGSVALLLAADERVTGARSVTAPLDPQVSDVERLGRALFTNDVFAFEITALLLTVAVVGAVVLTRRTAGAPIDLDEFPEGTAAEAFPETHGVDPDPLDGDVPDPGAPGPGAPGSGAPESGDPGPGPGDTPGSGLDDRAGAGAADEGTGDGSGPDQDDLEGAR